MKTRHFGLEDDLTQGELWLIHQFWVRKESDKQGIELAADDIANTIEVLGEYRFTDGVKEYTVDPKISGGI